MVNKVLKVNDCLKDSELPKKLGLCLKPGKEYNISNGKVKLIANNQDFSGTVFIPISALLADKCGLIMSR